ncbi:MAG TPA: hypothetical protein VG276_10265 [Actinomycetes bacterium]|jgi:hypothetical protein|nr:hypothetical protein [Actinomycetes bacterium]
MTIVRGELRARVQAHVQELFLRWLHPGGGRKLGHTIAAIMATRALPLIDATVARHHQQR